MRIILTFFVLLFFLSSHTIRTICDTDKLYGKWRLVESYKEGTITVDSLLKQKIVSRTSVRLTYLKSGLVENDQGDYSDTKMFTLDKEKCAIQIIGSTANHSHTFYILHLDNYYLIESGRGMIYFYERAE
ncbi:MAG: hypothetical protein K0R51_1400 [Cytophagaceae bacterium]|jgi:hypothetical protein|nr:hypothetical protein [Cytophagaceae bacterium]